MLKPKHSAFFETTLDTLLAYLGAKTLIMAGLAGNICILFSANDAYMRDHNLVVPADCVVSNTAEENAYALQQIQRVLKGDIRRPPSWTSMRSLAPQRPASKADPSARAGTSATGPGGSDHPCAPLQPS